MNSEIDLLRFGAQLFMIILAGFLFLTGVIYFNILFILASLILALIFGRFFCGWFCPLGFWTERILGRSGEGYSFPDFFKTKLFRAAFLVTFLSAFITVWYFSLLERGLFAISMIMTMFTFATITGLATFDKSWCAYICPWGILSSLLGKKARYQIGIKGNCISCKNCVDTCIIEKVPEEAVEQKQESKEETPIFSSRCIRCLQCKEACPQDAIQVIDRKSE